MTTFYLAGVPREFSRRRNPAPGRDCGADSALARPGFTQTQQRNADRDSPSV